MQGAQPAPSPPVAGEGWVRGLRVPWPKPAATVSVPSSSCPTIEDIGGKLGSPLVSNLIFPSGHRTRWSSDILSSLLRPLMSLFRRLRRGLNGGVSVDHIALGSMPFFSRATTTLSRPDFLGRVGHHRALEHRRGRPLRVSLVQADSPPIKIVFMPCSRICG